MDNKHTPLPWKVIERMIQGYDGEFVTHANGACETETEAANRELIVRAVNAHEELLSMLAFVKQSIRPDMGYEDVISLQGQIAQAIAKAEGR